MSTWKTAALVAAVGILLPGSLQAQSKTEIEPVIKSGATLAVKPMNGFEYYLLAAFYKKHIPLKLIRDPQKASYVIEGRESSSRAGISKVFWMGTDADHQDMSLDVVRASDGQQVMHEENSRSLPNRGLQTMAEGFANHLQEKVDPKPIEIERPTILSNPKVYVAVNDEFRTALLAAFQQKNVPIKVVESKDEADYLLEGDSQSTKADTRRKVMMLSWQSREQASVVLSNAKDGQVVFAYAYYYDSSRHGLRSSAESCAKHLGEKLGSADKK